MHELRIASDLSEIVLEVAVREKVSYVRNVNIVFGKLVQIVPDIFKTAFRECARGTLAEDAELLIEILPVKAECRRCKTVSDIEDNLFFCSSCSSTDLEIIQGREMFVKCIEAEE